MKPLLFDDLILGLELRSCAVCRTPTYWMRPRQSAKGYCPDHCLPGDTTFGQAYALVRDTFDTPGAAVEVVRPAPPEPMEPAAYATWVRVAVTTTVLDGRGVLPPYVRRTTGWALPLDAGPCAGCSLLIRRYGDGGLTHCAACIRKRFTNG